MVRGAVLMVATVVLGAGQAASTRAAVAALPVAAVAVTADPAPQATPDAAVRLGPLTREQVELAYPVWVQAEADAAPEPAAIRLLAASPAGAEVTVYLGTWCSDSQREVGRLWRVFDELAGEIPFQISYVGVDRAKTAPATLLAGADVHQVPTFVVRRDGREVGRVVEKAPHGIERDLGDLLAGRVAGFLSATQKQPGASAGATEGASHGPAPPGPGSRSRP